MARVTARAAVMQMIYEHLAGGEGGEETLQMVYDQLRRDGVPGVDEVRPSEPGEGDRAYIARVLDGVMAHLQELDEKISAASVDWTLDGEFGGEVQAARLSVLPGALRLLGAQAAE